jgi:hypothetical protein
MDVLQTVLGNGDESRQVGRNGQELQSLACLETPVSRGFEIKTKEEPFCRLATHPNGLIASARWATADAAEVAPKIVQRQKRGGTETLSLTMCGVRRSSMIYVNFIKPANFTALDSSPLMMSQSHCDHKTFVRMADVEG